MSISNKAMHALGKGFGWSEDDASGKAHIEAAEDFKYPDDEAQAEIAESTIIEGLQTKLTLTPGVSHKRMAMAQILFGFHFRMFPGESIPTLAKKFKVTKAGLYKLNAELYGPGFGIEPRHRPGRDRMREARLRFLKTLPPTATKGEGNEKIESANASNDGDGVNGGAR